LARSRSREETWDWADLRAVALQEAQRVLGRTAAADDAAQEAVLRAWRHAGSCRARERPRPWVRSIARREALRTARAGSAALPIADDAAAITWDPGDVLHAIDVRRLVRRLDPVDRRILLCHYWGDLSCADTAAALGMPVGTVKIRLKRGRERLLRLLDPG
jgi:RNA polymerase sigma-70 factor, ECF subfamily